MENLMEKPRIILVVEDEIIVAENIREKLRGMGYVVPTVVSSGKEAIKKTAETRPDLVLMDIKLKGDMDGIEAARQIREDFSIPVIFLTAHSDESTLERAKIAEPYGYILKPLEEREFRTSVEMALYKHEMEKRLRETNARLETLIESIPDVIYFKDARRRNLVVNRAFERMTGLNREEILGKTDEQVLPRDLARNCRKSDDETVEKREPIRFEEQMKGEDGRTIYFETIKSPLLDEKGNVIGIVGVSRDITERKRAEEVLRKAHDELERRVKERTAELSEANRSLEREIAGHRQTEEALRESEASLKRAQRIAHIGSWDWDITGDNVHWSDELFRIHGLQKMPGNMMEMEPLDFVHPDDREKVRNAITEALAGVRPYDMEMRIVRTDGEIRTVYARGEIIRDGSGKPVRMLGTALDITGRKLAEEARLESEKKYRQLVENSLQGLVVIQGSSPGFVFTNSAAAEILGSDSGGFRSPLPAEITTLLHPEDRALFLRRYRDCLEGKPAPQRYEFRIMRRDGAERWIEMFSSRIYYHGEPAVQAALMDITGHKFAEEKMKKQLMRYELEDGKLYLAKETFPTLSHEAFRDLLKAGYGCHVISRTTEQEFRRTVEGDFEFFWISERVKDPAGNVVSPRLEEIERLIEGLPRKSAVLIERLDYLVFKNGVHEIISFAQRLWELAYVNSLIIILAADPSTLKKRELRLIEKEAMEIEKRRPAKLPVIQLRILRFLSRQNAVGVKPTYTAVIRELDSSKPTVRKHIRLLLSGDYVKETLVGNSKNLEITEKGERVFLK